MHSAASEQQAFDQAFRWISSGVPNDPSVTVTLDGTTRQADVTPTQLSEAIRQRMPTGELNNAEHLVLTPRANSISSLQSLLSDFTELSALVQGMS